MQQLPKRKTVIETLFNVWKPQTETEQISLDEALGRVLARDYEAVYSIPVVRASAMDGVAVSSKRFEHGIPDTSGWRLGDDFDDRYDAVIRIEDVTISEDGHLTEEIKSLSGMEIFCMMEIEKGAAGYQVKQKGWKGGSMVSTLGAGAYYITDLEKTEACVGETVDVALLRGEEEF